MVVEVGTNIGYGAIVLARAAPLAKVITIELSAALVKTARGFIEEAGLSARIEVRQGAALEELQKLEGPIDLAYIDCVKEEYPRYLELLVPLLSERGVVIADNAMWRGLVARRGDIPEGERARTAAMREFNTALVNHPRLRGVVLPPRGRSCLRGEDRRRGALEFKSRHDPTRRHPCSR